MRFAEWQSLYKRTGLGGQMRCGAREWKREREWARGAQRQRRCRRQRMGDKRIFHHHFVFPGFRTYENQEHEWGPRVWVRQRGWKSTATSTMMKTKQKPPHSRTMHVGNIFFLRCFWRTHKHIQELVVLIFHSFDARKMPSRTAAAAVDAASASHRLLRLCLSFWPTWLLSTSQWIAGLCLRTHIDPMCAH